MYRNIISERNGYIKSSPFESASVSCCSLLHYFQSFGRNHRVILHMTASYIHKQHVSVLFPFSEILWNFENLNSSVSFQNS